MGTYWWTKDSQLSDLRSNKTINRIATNAEIAEPENFEHFIDPQIVVNRDNVDVIESMKDLTVIDVPIVVRENTDQEDTEVVQKLVNKHNLSARITCLVIECYMLELMFTIRRMLCKTTRMNRYITVYIIGIESPFHRNVEKITVEQIGNSVFVKGPITSAPKSDLSAGNYGNIPRVYINELSEGSFKLLGDRVKEIYCSRIVNTLGKKDTDDFINIHPAELEGCLNKLDRAPNLERLWIPLPPNMVKHIDVEYMENIELVLNMLDYTPEKIRNTIHKYGNRSNTTYIIVRKVSDFQEKGNVELLSMDNYFKMVDFSRELDVQVLQHLRRNITFL